MATDVSPATTTDDIAVLVRDALDFMGEGVELPDGTMLDFQASVDDDNASNLTLVTERNEQFSIIITRVG